MKCPVVGCEKEYGHDGAHHRAAYAQEVKAPAVRLAQASAGVKALAEKILKEHVRDETYCTVCADNAGPIVWPCDAAKLAQAVMELMK